MSSGTSSDRTLSKKQELLGTTIGISFALMALTADTGSLTPQSSSTSKESLMRMLGF